MLMEKLFSRRKSKSRRRFGKKKGNKRKTGPKKKEREPFWSRQEKFLCESD